MEKNKINYLLLNITILMGLLYITVTNIGTWINILGSIIHLFAPFIIAFIIAYVLHPVLEFLERHNIKHGIGVAIIMILFLAIIALLLYLLLPGIYNQLITLSTSSGKVINKISDFTNINLGSLKGTISEYIKDATSLIGDFVTRDGFNAVGKSLGILANSLITYVSAIYFLAYMKDIRKFIKKTLKKTKRGFEYVKKLDDEIGKYIKGLVLFMIVQFVEYSILFLIIGHPNWLLLGTLAGLLSIIPYFGGITTNLIAIFMATVVSTKLLIATIIICIIFPQVDGYFTSPKIYGHTVNVNPLITIILVSIGGTLAGPVGIACALPVFILIRATYDFFEKDLKKSVKTLQDAI